MTTTDSESGPTDAQQSDIGDLDLLVAYVREQRKEQKSWTQQLGRFTVYIALAAFFFGVGTLSDVRDRIAPPPPSPAQAAKSRYIETLDGYCGHFTSLPAYDGTGATLAKIANRDLEVLEARKSFNWAWNFFPVPKAMDPKDAGAFRSITSYYFAASDLLQAAIGRANASDREGYALDVGLYRQTNAAFLKAASDFGFTVCNHYWPIADVPQP